MIYLPAILFGMLFVLLQWNDQLLIDYYGKKATLTSYTGQCYRLRMCMTLGGKGCDIPISAKKLESGERDELDELCELFFKRGKYHLTVKSDEIPLYLKENGHVILLKGTRTLVNGDKIIVDNECFYDVLTFRMGE